MRRSVPLLLFLSWAFFLGAVLAHPHAHPHAESRASRALSLSRRHDGNTKGDGDKGGKAGKAGGGKIQCQSVDSAQIIVSPLGTKKYTLAVARESSAHSQSPQLVVGPPEHEYTVGVSASLFDCASAYMGTHLGGAQHAGWFQVEGKCITVDLNGGGGGGGGDAGGGPKGKGDGDARGKGDGEAEDLPVTLEPCQEADAPGLEKQWFTLAEDTSGVYARFVGGAPGQEREVGFRIDDTDPDGLVVAVQGKGKVVLALDG